jgi:ABC-type antimicrobial peptide transport system permease subunit
MNGYGRTVVGVVQSIRWGGPESDIDPEVFIPFAQTSHPSAQVLLRTAWDPGSLIPAFDAAIRSAAPGTTTIGVVKLEERYAELIAQRKFNMIVLAIFGTVAVAIAAVGVYALMAFTVAQRRRELGVRMALGAVPSGIVSLVLGGALRLLFAGLVPGLAAALLFEQWAQAFLFKAPPRDATLYAGVAFVLVAAGVIAAVGPARRATRVDPLVALRAE